MVQREIVFDVVEKSQARVDKEEAKRVRLKAGELGLDMDGMRDKLIRLGVEFEE